MGQSTSSAAKEALQHPENKEHLAKTFAKLDVNKCGGLIRPQLDTLVDALIELDMKNANMEQLGTASQPSDQRRTFYNACFEFADKDHDGHVTLEEFISFIESRDEVNTKATEATAKEFAETGDLLGAMTLLLGRGLSLDHLPDTHQRELLRMFRHFDEDGDLMGWLDALPGIASCVFYPSDNYSTPLIQTVIGGCVNSDGPNISPLVRKLIEQKADPDAKQRIGLGTALHLAIDANKPEIAQQLVECGASINIKNGHGTTALAMAQAKNMNDLVEFMEME